MFLEEERPQNGGGDYQKDTGSEPRTGSFTRVGVARTVEWVSPLTGAFPSKNRTCEFPRIRLKQHDRYRLCYR